MRILQTVNEVLQCTNGTKVNCSKCQEKWNIYYQFCPTCDLPPWTSKNKKIDKIIKAAQLESFLEWIEYEEFNEMKLIAEGGFGSVSKAIWNSGYIISFNKNQRKLIRAGPSFVALKVLFNSSNANCNTIQEIQSAVINSHFGNMARIFGISRDSETKNYILVLRFYEDGLQSLHERQYIHRDLHSGNILCVEKCMENRTKKRKIHIDAIYKSRSISKIIEEAGVNIIAPNGFLRKLQDNTLHDNSIVRT
ncbi:10412_t:CDS:2 [Ambispora leptoticha]|uniref:10412_t:CDS:1 n=1 Tax=Ambispora leptoticha TaxID=144679 RepID=A0A9N8YY74_9GLOM|nr:10412_t:CDS:2 [Ambispora leptoticha]